MTHIYDKQLQCEIMQKINGRVQTFRFSAVFLQNRYIGNDTSNHRNEKLRPLFSRIVFLSHVYTVQLLRQLCGTFLPITCRCIFQQKIRGNLFVRKRTNRGGGRFVQITTFFGHSAQVELALAYNCEARLTTKTLIGYIHRWVMVGFSFRRHISFI